MNSTESKASILSDDAHVLAAIHELAVFDAMWRRDHRGEQNGPTQTLTDVYVADTDILKFYSRPTLNTAALRCGLLNRESESEKSGTKNLAVFMAAHIFPEGQSSVATKLLLPIVRTEIENIREAVAQKGFEELKGSDVNLKGLNALASRLNREMRSESSGFETGDDAGTREIRIQRAAQVAKKEFRTLFPLLFGDSAVAEATRFSELFDYDPPRTVDALRVSELKGILEGSRSDIDVAQNRWLNVFRGVKRDVGNTENRALVLASIEVCNRKLREANKGFRLVLITASRTVFDAVLFGSGCIALDKVPIAKRDFFKLSKLASSVNISRYYAQILEALGSGSGHPRYQNVLEMERLTPLRDPRYFLADPAFMVGAIGEDSILDSGELPNLTNWLKAFVSRLDYRDEKIAKEYLSRLDGLKKNNVWGENHVSVKHSSNIAEPQSDVSEFLGKWEGFLASLARRETFAVTLQRKRLRLLQSALTLIDAKDFKIFEAEFTREVEESHSKLTANVTELAIGRLSNREIIALPPQDRCVAPLVLQSFQDAQKFVIEIQSLASQAAKPAEKTLATIDQVETDATAERIRSQFSELPSFLNPTEHPRDAPDFVSKSYLDLLLRAYSFCVFGEWRGALFLASQAYRLVQDARSTDTYIDSRVRISGREAAYVAVIAARGRVVQDRRRYEETVQSWLLRMNAAIERESSSLSNIPKSVTRLHQLRAHSEEFALQLTIHFENHFYKYDRLLDQAEKKQFSLHGYELLESMRECTDALNLLKQSDQNNPRGELHYACAYVYRQTAVNQVQWLSLIAADSLVDLGKQTDEIARLREHFLAAEVACENSPSGQVPFSKLHAFAKHMLNYLDNQNIENRDKLIEGIKALQIEAEKTEGRNDRRFDYARAKWDHALKKVSAPNSE